MRVQLHNIPSKACINSSVLFPKWEMLPNWAMLFKFIEIYLRLVSHLGNISHLGNKNKKISRGKLMRYLMQNLNM